MESLREGRSGYVVDVVVGLDRKVTVIPVIPVVLGLVHFCAALTFPIDENHNKPTQHNTTTEMEQHNVVAANASDFKEEADDAVQILEFLRAVHMGQDLPPDVRKLLEDLFFRHTMRTEARMQKAGLRDERLFQKLLEKSKIEFAPSITILHDALTKSCGKASKNSKDINI